MKHYRNGTEKIKPKGNYKIGYCKPPNAPWQKGQSGNPAGKFSIPLDLVIRREIKADPRLAQKIIKKITAMALKGNLEALEMIFNAMQKMPKKS